MIYRKYLEKLLGNKTKVALLRVFADVPDKAWTIRELARFIHTYNTTVQDNLPDLEDMGIVEKGMHGKGMVVKVKKDSFVFSHIVAPLFGAEKKTFDALTASLKDALPKGTMCAVLFGSVAAHTETPHSDIDILVIAADKRAAEESIGRAQSRIAREFGNELSLHLLTPAEFRQKQQTPFIKEAKKTGIVLQGRWL